MNYSGSTDTNLAKPIFTVQTDKQQRQQQRQHLFLSTTNKGYSHFLRLIEAGSSLLPSCCDKLKQRLRRRLGRK